MLIHISLVEIRTGVLTTCTRSLVSFPASLEEHRFPPVKVSEKTCSPKRGKETTGSQGLGIKFNGVFKEYDNHTPLLVCFSLLGPIQQLHIVLTMFQSLPHFPP